MRQHSRRSCKSREYCDQELRLFGLTDNKAAEYQTQSQQARTAVEYLQDLASDAVALP